MGRVLLAGILSGLAVFGWGVVSWMALPLHINALHNLPQDQAAADAFLGQFPESGVYHYPGMPSGPAGQAPTAAEMEAAFERMEAGPHVSLMVVHPHGSTPMPPRNFIIGLLLHVVAATMIAGLLSICADSLPRFGQRFGFVLCFGGFVILFHYLHETLWWGYPLEFAIATIVDIAAGSMLIGLITAALIRPAPRAPETES